MNPEFDQSFDKVSTCTGPSPRREHWPLLGLRHFGYRNRPIGVGPRKATEALP
jgi:hypothetical protein